MILPFNDWIPKELLPIIFRNVFPSIDTLKSISFVCKIWRSECQKAWRVILEDKDDYPILRKYQILYEVSLVPNFGVLVKGNLERKEEYEKNPEILTCINTHFIRKSYPPILRIQDLKQLIAENNFEEAFARSSETELQSELQQHIIEQVGYNKCLDLIFLFTTGELLKRSCTTYLTNGFNKLSFLNKLKNGELPDQGELKDFFHHPFVLSLKLLKEKSFYIESLHLSVFDTYYELFMLPFIDYFKGVGDQSGIKYVFDVLPTVFLFHDSTKPRIYKSFYQFLPSILDYFELNKLIENKLQFIKSMKETFVQRELLIPFLKFNFDQFYLIHNSEEEGSFDLFWPHLYEIEHALNCEKFINDKGLITYFDRSTEEFMIRIMTEKRRFCEIFKSNKKFAQAVFELLKECPERFNNLIIFLKEKYNFELSDKSTKDIFFDLLEMFNEHYAPFKTRIAFIDSAPDDLKKDLRIRNCELRTHMINRIFI